MPFSTYVHLYVLGPMCVVDSYVCISGLCDIKGGYVCREIGYMSMVKTL